MIIVFDSGVGGFSLLRELGNQQISLPLIYLADQAHFPYGDKSPDWLSARLAKIAKWAQALKPSIFILACNTGTVSGISQMRELLSCPVVGVEPVVKPLGSYDKALVLATPVTVDSPRTRELVAQFGGHVQVVSVPGLASAIENNDSVRVKKILQEISIRVLRENIQAIGLSCTHYPLVADLLQPLVPQVHLYDPSRAVVHQLKKYLSPADSKSQQQQTQFLTTGEVIRFNEQILYYLGIKAEAKKVEI